ncbi:hypothetical protein IEQ34_006155 [Dendrobium chrysotoxum]|uniref:Uncharacterized protein n=1 Tax=Dendrobium chrysotoxum TaxID=161865 RepID=A0AAV7HDV5_DENCH|nr:hypothetical protein IEQ34_006155 [Dendrobium chrysotoxum]
MGHFRISSLPSWHDFPLGIHELLKKPFTIDLIRNKYLSKVCKVGLKDVFNVVGVDSVNIVAEGGENPEGFIAAREVSLEI